MQVSITQSAIFTALGQFITATLPGNVEVIQGQVNRVPQPKGDAVVMWPSRTPRLSTNGQGYTDNAFVGSIAALVLTITSVIAGAVIGGQVITGTGVAANTIVGAQISGSPGGVGTYAVAPTQTVVPGTVLSAGVQGDKQEMKVEMQLDVHGPNSWDNSTILATMFRSEYATDFFTATGIDISPLYAEDPRQMPFLTGEQQYEDRWTVDVVLQSNPVVSIPQQFADALTVDLIEVDAVYPPT